jgi:hypothetical protein
MDLSENDIVNDKITSQEKMFEGLEKNFLTK